MKTENQCIQSLTKTYSRTIWNPFVKAVEEYKLLQAHDRVAVCVSGGKDSFLLAVLMQQLFKIGQIPFELMFVIMDPGYTEENLTKIISNLRHMGIEPKVFKTNIFRVVAKQRKNPCFLCSRMRRGHLYQFASELGCNKIALGHHYDDVIETILMGMLYGGQVQTMLPRLTAANYKNMELIRPLYLVRESKIKAWATESGLDFLRCSCSFAEHEEGLKRQEIKKMIQLLEQGNAQVPQNIFNSVKNIDLRRVLGWHKGERRGTFLDLL